MPSSERPTGASASSSDRERPRGSLFLRTAAYSALVTILTVGVFTFRFVGHERTVLYQHLEDRAEVVALALEAVGSQAFDSNDFSSALAQASRMVQSDEDLLFVVFTPTSGRSHLQLAGARSEQRDLGPGWRPSSGASVGGLRTGELVEGELQWQNQPSARHFPCS